MNAEDKAAIDLIREHMKEAIGTPSDEDCISFALRFTADNLKSQPIPRHPRTIK